MYMVVLAHCHKVLLLLTKVDASVSIKVMLRVEHHSDHILENTFFFLVKQSKAISRALSFWTKQLWKICALQVTI